MNRRGFCGLAALGIGATAIGRPLLAAAALRRASISAVVYDERYADGREFAASLRRNGATALPMSGSSAGHWYGELGTMLRCRGERIAGYGTYADFLIARTCGREMGLSLVFEGVHDARGSARVTHRYHSPGAARLFGKLARRAALRPGELAEFLNEIGNDGDGDQEVVEAAGRRSSDHPGYLVSWLLEPRAPRPGSPSA